jgi:myosin heavy subunit
LTPTRHDTNTTKENYEKLRLNLRESVGVTVEGMNGIIRAISAALIIGNIGFQQQQSKVALISRRFHTFPEGLEICEDLLDLENGKWSELQDVSTNKIAPFICYYFI